MAKMKPFEKQATEYDDWFTKHRFAYESELRAVKQHLPQSKMGIEIGVAEAIPFGDSTFDFALMVTTICFVDDLEASFKEAHRILKHNGCLTVGFIDRDSAIGRLDQQHKEDNVFYRVATFYSVPELTWLE